MKNRRRTTGATDLVVTHTCARFTLKFTLDSPDCFRSRMEWNKKGKKESCLLGVKVADTNCNRCKWCKELILLGMCCWVTGFIVAIKMLLIAGWYSYYSKSWGHYLKEFLVVVPIKGYKEEKVTGEYGSSCGFAGIFEKGNVTVFWRLERI